MEVTSKGSFTSEHANKARQMLATTYAEGVPNLVSGLTYVFEIIFPEGRIVCDYGGVEKLVLTGIFDPVTGQELNRDTHAPAGFEVVESEHADSLGNLAARQALDVQNKEGFVIYFPRHNARIKLKFPTYCYLHRVLSGLTSVRVWEELVASNGKLTEEFLKVIPDEFHGWLHAVVNDLRWRVRDMKQAAESAFEKTWPLAQESRKAFAMGVMEYDELMRPLLFALHDTKDITPILWKRVKPEPTRPGGVLLLN